MKILAVDDDPVFMDILITSLGALGHYDVMKAGSAADALAVLRSRETRFDCILLDIQMPEMDGVTLCQIVRALPGYRQVPIVMITSMSAKQYIDDAFAAGATDYVTKPLDRLDLKARMGMVGRLVEERHQLTLLAQQASQRDGAVELQINFDTALLIPGFDRGIEFLALENYLLTLGKKGMLTLSAFGIHIENAEQIFCRAPRSTFVDMLGDVAMIISEVIKMDEILIAYAGSGNFVGVTRGELTWPQEDMNGIMDLGLRDFESLYTSERLPTPKVRVGALVKSPFFSLGSPTRVLERAITAAQLGRQKKASLWLEAA